MLINVLFQLLLFVSLDGHHRHDQRVVDDHLDAKEVMVCGVNDKQFILVLLPHCIKRKDSLFARHIFLFGAVNR